MARMQDMKQRFWQKVEKTETCWLWRGATFSNGYGHFVVEKKHCLAHRIAWELAYGPIPAGLIVMHVICDTPLCVRADHLCIGTHSDNTQDMIRKGRQPIFRAEANPAYEKRRSHCKNGHALIGENVLVYGRVHRCRICTKAYHRARYLASRS